MKQITSFTLSPETIWRLKQNAKIMGLSRSAFVELVLKKISKQSLKDLEKILYR